MKSFVQGVPVQESAIAVRIFQRSGRWNSKRDTIVRVNVNRLRHLLASYYAKEGKSDACEIRIPKGTYVPEVHWRDPNNIAEKPSVRARPRAAASDVDLERGEHNVLVGRDAELAELRAYVKRARNGDSVFVCVVAEPGVGKTALIEQFVFESSAEPDLMIATGCCYPDLEETEMYGPWRRLLDGLAHQSKSIERLFLKTAPAWAAFLKRNTESAAMFQAAGAKREMREFLTGLSRRASIILFLDDLHWADTATVDLLQYLCLQGGGLRLLIIAAYRPSDMRRRQNAFLKVRAELIIRDRCIDMPLRELTRSEVERVVDVRFAPHRFGDGFTAWLFAQTQGNAFTLTRVIDHAVRRGWVRRCRRTWVTEGEPSTWCGDLPDSIEGWIAQKLEDVDQDDMVLACMASVHGAEFEVEVLAEALKRDLVSVERHLQRLAQLYGLLTRLPDVQLADFRVVRRYRFAHPLYQEALRRVLGPFETARLSLQLAEALLRLYHPLGSRSAIAARLLDIGGDTERALGCYLQAAWHAVQISAYRQALEMSQRAEALIASMERTVAVNRMALECLTLQALSASTLDGFGAAQIQGIYVRAVRVGRTLRDETASFPVANVYWSFVSTTDYRPAEKIAGGLLTQAAATGDRQSMALARLAAGVSWIHLGEMQKATAVLEEAVALWHDSSEGRSHFHLFTFDPAVATLLMLARALSLSGLWTTARKRCEDALALAQRLRHERTLAYAVALSADIFHLGGDVQRTLELAQEAEHMAAKFELPYESIWARAIKAWALAQSGETSTAISLYRDCLAQYRGPASTKLLCRYAEVLIEAGRLSEGVQILNEVARVVQTLGERYFEPELLRLRGELILRKNRSSRAGAERAERLFQQALDLAATQGAKALELRAAISNCRLVFLTQGPSRHSSLVRLRQLVEEVSDGGETPDVQRGAALLLQPTIA